MYDWAGQIKVLVWDVDGTLYRTTEASFAAVREAEYQVIMHHTGFSHDRAKAEFGKIHNIVTPSGTQTAALLSHISAAEAAVECEWYFDRSSFVQEDAGLVKMFQKLEKKSHIIFSNSDKQKLILALKKLGLTTEIFTEIVTPEDTNTVKPDPAGFRYVISKTGLPPEAHLMIGDRVSTDVIPAKSVGMHTCLVWPTEPGEEADVTLPTVYDVATLF